MNPRKAFYAIVFAIITLSPLTLINQDTVINVYASNDERYLISTTKQEVKLLSDSTFYYIISGCSGYQEGNGTYVIVNDTLNMIFDPMPKEISSLLKIDSTLSKKPDISEIKISYLNKSNSINKGQCYFDIKNENDTQWDNKYKVLIDNDTTFNILYPKDTNNIIIRLSSVSVQSRYITLNNKYDYTIEINSEYTRYYYIHNKKLMFSLNKNNNLLIHSNKLITQDQDTLVIQSIK